MLSEAQKRAIKKYREKNKEKLNAKKREKYANLKESCDPKYFKMVAESISLKCRRSKEKTAQNRHIRALMSIEI